MNCAAGTTFENGLAAAPAVPLRVLSISCVFPNPREKHLGTFVNARLQALSRHAEVRVISPVPVLDYARRKPAGGIPMRRREDNLEVWHPSWMYPPLGGALNPLLLSAQLIGPVRRIREEYPFDLLDAHFGYPDGIAAALLSGLLRVPFAVTLRGNETMHARHTVRRMLLRGALRRAALVIAVSEPLRRLAANLGVRDSRIKVVPNGIDPFLFRLRDRNECRRRHGIAPDARVILSAGSLIERKGHHRVIAALGAMAEEGVAAELLIAGGPGREGTFGGRLRRLAGESVRVRLVGEVTPDTLAELMNAADVLCLASSREGWPNVVNEALACGTPVVATAVGGVPEMIPSPAFGFVIAPNDQQALVAALHSALDTRWDRTAIGAWGQSRSWDQVAREAIDHMRQAVAPRRS